MKNLSTEETVEILKKVFISSINVKDEDLELFMENSKKVDSEIIYKLLLTFQESIGEEEMHRIIKFLPEKHKDYFEIFLPIGSLISKQKEKLYQIYQETLEQNKRRKCSIR